MFLKNDVLEYPGPPTHAIRILWIDREAALAYTFELRRAHALPRPVPLQVLAADVSARRARLLLADPWAARPASAPARHQRLQMKAWDAVQALHRDLPAVYLQAERAAMLAAYAASHDISKASLMRYLRRYWERGQTLDALLPDYGNSGAPGKTRVASTGIKRGRPRKDALAGTNADAGLRAVFRAAAARHAATHKPFSRRGAYRQMLDEYFKDCAPGALPSFGQFSYWLERDGIAAGLVRDMQEAA